MNTGLLSQIDAYVSDIDVDQGAVSTDDVAELLDKVREVPPPRPLPVLARHRLWAAIAAAAAVLLVVAVPVVFNATRTNGPPATGPAPTATVSPPTIATRTFVGQSVSTIAVGTDAVWVGHGREVSWIDPETLEVLGTSDIGGTVTHLIASPTDIWAVSIEAGLVRIDPLTGEQKSQEPATEENIAVWRTISRGRAITDHALWVTSPLFGTVAKYGMEDGALGPHEATIRLGGASFDGAGPTDIAFGHGSLWVTYPGGEGSASFPSANTVFRIDPTANEITASIVVDSGATGVYVGETSVWVANFSEWKAAEPATVKRISRIDPQTNTIIATVDVPITAHASDAGFGHLWVLDTETNSLLRLDIP